MEYQKRAYQEIRVSHEKQSNAEGHWLAAHWVFPGNAEKTSRAAWETYCAWADTSLAWEEKCLRDIGPAEPEHTAPIDRLKDIGEELYDTLVATGVRSNIPPVHDWNLVCSQAPNACFRIVQQFQNADADFQETPLWRTPWESLHSKTPIAGVQDSFALSERVSLVRRILGLPDLAAKKLLVDRLPVRVLVFAPAPSDLENNDQLDEASEIREISAAVKRVGGRRARITVVKGKDATFARLKAEAKRHHVVHFIGHGDIVDDQAQLLLVNNDGRSHWCGISEITQWFRDHDVKLVCLNGCRTAAIGAFAQGFPAVVGMQFRISDEAALAFAKGFYTDLLKSGQLDHAVWSGRQTIHAEDGPREREEFLTPVLYMQPGDGYLFRLRCPWCWGVLLIILLGALSGYAAYLSHRDAPLPSLHDVRLLAQSGDAAASIEYVPVPDVGGVMHSGDNFRVHVRLNREAHVQMLLLDSERTLAYLSPQRHEVARMGPLAAGVEHVFPGPDAGFEMDDAAGTEALFVLVSPSPLEGLENTVEQANAYLDALDADTAPATIIAEVEQRMRAMRAEVHIKQYDLRRR